MALPVPSPRAVLSVGRFAVGQVMETAATVAAVPVRVMRLLGHTEELIGRISVAVDSVESLLTRVHGVLEDTDEAIRQTRVVAEAATLAVQQATEVAAGAGALIGEARRVSDGAATVVAGAAGTAAGAEALLAAYAPALQRGAPLARRFVQELSEEEVTAAIRLIDELPRLREHLHTDVMPLLGTLDRVGPDLHALLEVTSDLKLAVAGIPGLKMLRRRGEDRLAEEQGADLDA